MRAKHRTATRWVLLLLLMSVAAILAAAEQSLSDEKIERLLKRYEVPGAVIAIIEDGILLSTKAYGYAELDTGTPMTADTICRVESISKSVTAWAVLDLCEQGLLRLDAPAASYLSSWDFPEGEYDFSLVTIEDLLRHTSGLDLGTIGVRYDPRLPVPSLESRLTGDAHLIAQRGSFWYSNTGYNILEKIIEEVTAKEFASYMDEAILAPLGMEDSSFVWESSLRIPDGHTPDGRPIVEYVYPDKASGGLFAPAGDIAKFLIAGMGQPTELLEPESREALVTKQTELTGFYSLVFDGYSYGHFIEYLSDGSTAISHGGQGSGWMTHFHSIPERGDAIIILTNSQRSWPLFSELLTLWSHDIGIEPVGMSLIHTASEVVLVATILIIIGSLVALSLTARSLKNKHLHLSLSLRHLSAGRLFLLLLSVSLISLLLWAATRPYLFITSIFPTRILLMVLSVCVVACSLFLRGLCRRSS